MLHVYWGTDRESAREKSEKAFSTLQSKRSEAEVIVFDSDSWDVEKIKELIRAQGLFEKKYIIRITYALDKKERIEEFDSLIEDLGKSENAFVVLEESFLAPQKKKIEKHAFSYDEFAQKKKKFEENIFALADAYGAKDKKNLWLLYTQFMRKGIPPEELHGILLWQVKSITATYKAKTSDEAGMKEYPFSKAKRFARNFTEEENSAHYDELIALYRNAHQGKYDLGVALERFMLRV
ncbi:MAG: hypothetical protein WDZ88_01745 [Candidatus Paceibacterota bacterium]